MMENWNIFVPKYTYTKKGLAQKSLTVQLLRTMYILQSTTAPTATLRGYKYVACTRKFRYELGMPHRLDLAALANTGKRKRKKKKLLWKKRL